MDGWMDPAMEALPPSATEPNIDLTLHESRVDKLPDLSPATDSEPPMPVPSESNWAPIMEFTSTDIFQHSPLGDILNSLRSLTLSGESWPNYVRQDWDADGVKIHRPPTTHLVAIVDDLTNMLDFDSEDIDGMDDDAGEPPPTGHWTPTSSHDVYMVDTPKENDHEEQKDAMKGCPLEKQSKRRRKRRSKSRLD